MKLSNIKIITSGWLIVWIIVVIIVISFALLMPLSGEDVLPEPKDQNYNTTIHKTIFIPLIKDKTGINFTIVKEPGLSVQHSLQTEFKNTWVGVNYTASKSGESEDNFTFRYAFKANRPYPILPYLIPYLIPHHIHKVSVFILPKISVPSNKTVNATSPLGANVPFTVTAVDNVDGPIHVNCTPPSGHTFPIRDTILNNINSLTIFPK